MVKELDKLLFPTTVYLVLLVCSCVETQNPYKIFVAGHAYGNANEKRIGFHPPFTKYIKKANEDQLIELGFLTGDFLKNYETEAFPLAAVDDIKNFNFPVYTCAGNHELLGDYTKYFNEYYYYKKYQKDLYIILTPGLDEWNISGDQLVFLKRTLDREAHNARHIIILMHELIWWSPTNRYKDVKINYQPHFPGKTNYESVIKPLLLSYDRPITLIAGDLGATAPVSPIMYAKEGKITLIGSGMGSWKYDHVLELTMLGDSIHYDIVPIGNTSDMGILENYSYGILNSAK